MAKPKSTFHQQMLTTAANLDAQYSELISYASGSRKLY